MSPSNSAGIVTILFTDIEGSTRLWEQEGDRMSRALAEHDALSRAAVEQNRGTIVKMTGDGMYAVFDDPQDALSASVKLQLALADPEETNRISLRLRCGVHLGTVERRDDDLFGNPVNRATRIMKAAHGGQVLVSQAVVDRVGDRLPGMVTLRDLGVVRLRDLASSERVYQLLHPQLRQDFPALRSLEATPNNLPQQVTSFVGRERELTETKALLENARLLTLLGMGGLGKTRLSLQIGADVLEKYPDGVWFVDLAAIRDPLLVPSASAQVLGVREEPIRPLTQTLCAHIRERRLLLILDNCEHLMEACASLVDSLLRAAPDVRILATSREALHIRGEQAYQVTPLSLPARNSGTEGLLRSGAVQLFVERARLQKPDIVVSEREAPAIAELCARLEGIPLALELAAARLRSFSIEEINTRLRDRFKFLTGGDRVAAHRHQTLRALVSWSYDLLAPNEQILLDRLSVFEGGFDFPAADAVCGADPLVSQDIVDVLPSLVEKSLVIVSQSSEGSRYGLLETIREFAQERLTARDDVAATAARHCKYYLGVAYTARPKLEGPDQAEWTRRLEVELDNIRAGIALALAGGVDPVCAVRFEVALMRFRIFRGYLTEGRNNIRAALERSGMQEPSLARGHALYVGGALAASQADQKAATRLLTECLAIRQGLGDMLQVAGTLSTLGVVHLQAGDSAKARDCEEQSLAIFRQLGNRIGEALALGHLGEISMQLDDDAHAGQMFEQCLAIARSIKHRELEAECERYLGELVLDAGNLQAAQERLARSLKVSRDAEDKRNEAIALRSLAKTDTVSGDHDSARKKLAEALGSFRALEMRAEALDCLEDCAVLLQAIGKSDSAVRLQAAAATVRGALALPRSPRGAARRQANIADARAALSETAFNVAWSDGSGWTLDEAIERALKSTAPSSVIA